jgi:polysaccharide biosynthesis protein PslG
LPQAADEQDIVTGGQVSGRHYRQTGGGTGLGYDVRVPFFLAMSDLGGPSVAGFPVTAPFNGVDGCLYQGFQIVLLQQCAGGAVQRANTFQILEEAGADARLEQLGIGKGQADTGASFDQSKQIRLGWLEDSAIRERYLSECGDGDPEAAIQLCGLPMNQPSSFGPFISQRFQRIAFQRWLVEGPGGIKAGDISRTLGGDLLKELGVIAGEAVRPHPIGQVPSPATIAFGRLTSPQAAPPTLSFGFQAEFFATSLRPQSINLIKDAGFGWAKQQVRWDQYEISQAECFQNRANCIEAPIAGPTRYFNAQHLGFLDAVVNDLNGSGLKVLLSVVNAPSFHAAPGGHSPSDPNTLRDFLQFIAGRYKGKVQAIETWNEQNLSWEWGGSRLWPNAPAAPPQGVRDFVELQKAAYRGVKAADPSIVVVLPALTPTGLGECWLNPEARNQQGCLDQVRIAIDDRLYLDFMYQVNGGEIKNYYDVVGVHPSGYNNPPDDWIDRQSVAGENFKGHGSFYIKRYQQLREIQLKYGDTKPMWFTEVGWSATRNVVGGYEYARENTEETRGKYFARLLDQVQQEAPYVTNVFIWNLNFRQVVGDQDEKYGFGLVNADGSPTPAYNCVKDYVRSGNKITRAECRL